MKVHLLISATGAPVGFFLTPGSYSDASGLLHFDFDLPPQAIVVGDKAIHATTAAGFELKVVLFILACSLQLLPLP